MNKSYSWRTSNLSLSHFQGINYQLIEYVESSRLSQVTPIIAIAQLNFIKESTSYIHNTILGISNTTFT